MEPIHSAASAFLRAHAVPRDASLGVAVSGGADSLALLEVLVSLGQAVGAIHVHHGVRGREADRDLEFTRERARALGVAFFDERVDASRRDSRSPEARARHLRYHALERVREREGYHAVATAHTLDDQAETVLLRVARGASPPALCGIRPVARGGRVLRPLLEVRRSAVRAYLRTRGIEWREDATNEDRRVPRNRIRHEILDLLERVHPGATIAVARLADSARDLSDWMDSEVAPSLAGLRHEGGLPVLDRAAIIGLPGPLRSHALARLMAEAGLGERISRRHLQRVERVVLSSGPGDRVSLPRGRMLVRAGDRLRVVDGARTSARAPRRLFPARPLEVQERELRLEWHRTRVPPARRSGAGALLLPSDVDDVLWLRGPEPADRMWLAGESRARPLSELFRVARWSAEERRGALVVTWRREIVWVVGLAAADIPGAGREGGWELRAVPLSRSRGTC